MALTQGSVALFAGHSTCHSFGPAQAAIVASLLTIAAMPRAVHAADSSAASDSPHPPVTLIDEAIVR